VTFARWDSRGSDGKTPGLLLKTPVGGFAPLEASMQDDHYADFL
jgi:hypothetical protein